VGFSGDHEAVQRKNGTLNEEPAEATVGTPELQMYGSYERALDDKGRFSFPMSFRAKEPGKEEEPLRFMIAEDHEGVVSLMTCAQYEKSLQAVQQLGTGQDEWDFRRWLAAHSQAVQTDSQGRVTIPQKYLEKIGARKRLLILGAITRIELWDPDRWDQRQAAAGKPAEKYIRAFRT